MHRRSSVLFVLLVALTLVTPAFAQDSSSDNAQDVPALDVSIAPDDRPQLTGGDMLRAEVVRLTNIERTSAGLAIAGGFSSPDAVVTAWMHSPGHRANILNPGLREIGVGIVRGGTPPQPTEWVQDFAAHR